MATKQNNISPQAILREIDARQFHPIYLLYGDETYYIDLISDYFQAHVLNEEEREFNLTVLYGKDITVADIVMDANQLPMFSDVRLTIIKEMQELEKADWDPLVNYIKEPNPQTILVLCYRKESFDSRTRIYKAIAENGVIFQSVKLRDYQLPAWIVDTVREKGLTIDQRSAELLAEFLGSNLGKIVSEIDKLKIVMDEKGIRDITPALIERNIGISKDYNNFELTSAIATGNILKVNRIIDYFAGNPKANSIAATTVVLFRFFADLLACHASKASTVNDIMASMHCPFPRAKELEPALRRYSSGKCLYAIEQIRELDARFKGFSAGSISDRDMLRETLFKIMH